VILSLSACLIFIVLYQKSARSLSASVDLSDTPPALLIVLDPMQPRLPALALSAIHAQRSSAFICVFYAVVVSVNVRDEFVPL
jgi:hypothetical protein